MSDLTPAASAGAPPEWRSIDSAPRDGTLFLACNLDQPSFGSWPMYRRVRHSVNDADQMETTDLGGWAKVLDIQPDWEELDSSGPEPQVSIAPDDLNRSVRYGWTPFPTPAATAKTVDGDRLIGTIGHVSQGRTELGALITSALSATERSDGAEMPEVALARYIEILRADEGDIVTIACDNPEAGAADKRVAIDCNGAWTGFDDRRFEGESVLQCLAKAVSARAALTEKAAGQ